MFQKLLFLNSICFYYVIDGSIFWHMFANYLGTYVIFFNHKQIVPERCRYEVLSTKIEIRLAKAEPIHWTCLEYNADTSVVQRVNVATGRSNFRKRLVIEDMHKCHSFAKAILTLLVHA